MVDIKWTDMPMRRCKSVLFLYYREVNLVKRVPVPSRSSSHVSTYSTVATDTVWVARFQGFNVAHNIYMCAGGNPH